MQPSHLFRDGPLGRSFQAFLVGISLFATAACSSGTPEKEGPLGCTKDTDCKADRVCIAGTCQEPPAGAASTGSVAIRPVATPGASTQAARPAPTQEPTAPTFRAVPESEWKADIGPRLRIGAVVAHQVFEGPFGPSPKSLFVVTREGDDFFATVWADGHGYRNGPLANTGGTATKVPAVSFFDADGDGTFDALVMATYSPKGGGTEVFENVLLRWKGKSVLRLAALETDIARLTSVAAVRAKLKK